MIIAANHMGDVHQRIIDRDHVVIYRHARRTNQDRIRDRIGGELHRAANDVMERDWLDPI